MAKRNNAPWPAGSLKKALANVLTDVGELLRTLDLEAVSLSPTSSAWRGFPLRVPRGFVARMRSGDPADPLLRQVLPTLEEDEQSAGFTTTGVILLNQAVLLAGVNDSVDALTNLGEALFDAGGLPYYLHMLDPVEGAAHFEVADDEARRLHAEVAARLPGYLVPRLVREVQGAPAKVGIDLWR
jgi:L-lysine 2,3-aminomutase